MIRKYLQHIAAVGLKHFFDLDYTMLAHSFTMLFVVAGFMKLVSYWLKEGLQEGVATVKNDYVVVKSQVAGLAERLDIDEDNAVVSYFKNLKNTLLTHKNLSA